MRYRDDEPWLEPLVWGVLISILVGFSLILVHIPVSEKPRPRVEDRALSKELEEDIDDWGVFNQIIIPHTLFH